MSTLRRRIRGNSIDFKLDSGRYMILDAPPSREQVAPKMTKSVSVNFVDHQSIKREAVPQSFEEEKPQQGVFQAAHKLLDELKKAYALILQEKEEQICQLREEISDLRTLARVLEAENERLKHQK